MLVPEARFASVERRFTPPICGETPQGVGDAPQCVDDAPYDVRIAPHEDQSAIPGRKTATLRLKTAIRPG